MLFTDMIKRGARMIFHRMNFFPSGQRFVLLSMFGMICLFQCVGHAVSLDWSGNYRFDFVNIDKSELKSGSQKSYLLNSLVLMPHIIPSDGFEVVSKIHLADDPNSPYKNSSQAGLIWGSSVNSGTATYLDDSNALSGSRPKTSLTVSQLYLKVEQEWGSLIIGRAPVQFGLGITHNAGNDPFNHWFDTRDMLAYKVHIGNLFIMPSVSKQFAGDFAAGNEISNQTLHFEYKNHDTGDWLGLFYETSKGSASANDIPPSLIGGASIDKSLSLNSYNIVLGKDFTDFNFRVEGGFQSGSTGVITAAGRNILMSSYAVISEFSILPGEGKNSWNIKAGTVSGDNPDTEDFEGFFVDRNYDIALILFNHSLGQNADIFKTKLGHNPSTSVKNSLDDEFISNVIFVTPQWIYQLADRWKMRNALTFARLNNALVKVGSSTETISSDVGLEWDLAFNYKANDNMDWKFELGVLHPGAAFKMGSANLKNSDTVLGFGTSAAITF